MQVKFYVLSEPQPDNTATPTHAASTVPAEYLFACQLCADFYRQGLRVYVFCQNQQDAELLDEVLWQFDAERFVPHNLAGEGPQRGAPIEISWQMPKSSRQVLINLTESIPSFANRYMQVIEFVPVAADKKSNAREKYKQYRQLGVTPETINVQ